MSIGKEIAYRRSARGKDATGSLVFDLERKRMISESQAGSPTKSKMRTIAEFPA